MNIAEVIRRAKRPERTVDLCLALDLVAEWEQLDRQRAVTPSDSLAGSDGTIEQRMEQLRAEMLESTIEVRLRALSRLAYDELTGAHPARRDEAGDVLPADVAGFNTATFRPALVRACWVGPTLEPDVLTLLLDEQLTSRQFEELYGTALLVNRGKVDIPFSLAASTTPRTSGGE
jgi:hypothetical protein